jgi:hypothetical protein
MHSFFPSNGADFQILQSKAKKCFCELGTQTVSGGNPLSVVFDMRWSLSHMKL